MSSRKYLITFALLLALGLLVFAAPRLLHVRQIQTELIRRAAESLEARIDMQRMSWGWTPLPHLTLIEATVTHPDYVLRLPRAEIYPDWLALLTGSMELSTIALQSPALTLNSSLFLQAGGKPPWHLPRASVTASGGTVHICSFAAGQVRVKELSLQAVNLKIKNRANRIDFVLQANSSFAGSIALQGKYHPGSLAYNGTVKAERFELQRLIEFATPTITPLSSQVDFSCEVTGQGFEDAQLVFDGNLPAFSLQRLDGAVPFTFGRARLQLFKKGQELGATIAELKLTDPAVSFSGTAGRYQPGSAAEPFYRLDLGARDIDLSGVRERILGLLGDAHTTRTVCNVVRGGRAKSASYQFDAPLARFKDLEAMTIRVDVESAEIHVPEVNLDLTQSSGPIAIEKGLLHGAGLTSWLGSNYGSNGSFSLGLSENNWQFTLDLDIDADLATLPQTLHHLIHQEEFRREVLKCSSEGRKMGHLTIGNDLRDFVVEVNVPDLRGATVHYERLSWPIALQAGSLHIKGPEVQWQQVAAAVGPHQLSECSGGLNWEKSGAPFAVKSFAADLDAGALLAELKRYPAIDATLSPYLSGAAGRLAVKKAEVSGPFTLPADWRYTLTASLDNTVLSSPELPAPVPVSRGRLEMDSTHLTLTDGQVSFLDSPLALSATLSHHLFADWSGRLVLDGAVTEAQGRWLATKDWIPPLFFPRTPCEIKNFAINFAADHLDILGTVANKTFSGQPVQVVVEVKVENGQHQQSSLHFSKAERDALVSLSGSRQTAQRELAFDGYLDWETVAALFTQHTIMSGKLSGLFTLTLPKRGSGVFSFDGRAEASDLEWVWGNSLRKLLVAKLSLEGDQQRLNVRQLALAFEGEQVSGSGGLMIRPQELTTNLSFHSASLSQEVLNHFIDDFLTTYKKFKGEGEGESGLARRITGEISIEADQFLLAPTIRIGKETSYRLTPFAGKINFSPNQPPTLTLTDSNLCGLLIDGTIKWLDSEKSSKEYILKNPAGSPRQFEQFLPCLGVKSTVISGPFVVNATLKDENGIISAGTFQLHAEKGVLQKMELLSKIFTLINFTDLYQGLFSSGFGYKIFEIRGHFEHNLLILDKVVMEGEGMDILAQGSIKVPSLEANLTIFIVPFKSLDKIINMVPWIGRIVGGKKRHILTYPVRMTGNLSDPELNALSPTAIGKAAINFVFDTITFPLDLLPIPKESGQAEPDEGGAR